MVASRPPVERRHFDVIMLKSAAAILAAAMFVGDRTTASSSLTGAAAVSLHTSVFVRYTVQSYSSRQNQISTEIEAKFDIGLLM